jgi:hypothetical protein
MASSPPGTIVDMRSFLSFLAVVLASGLAVGSLTAYVAHETVLNPERAGDVLAKALDRSDLREEVMARALPGYTSLPSAYRSDVDRLADNPRVDRALSSVRVDPDGRADLTPVRRELAQSLEEGGYGQFASQVRTADDSATVRVPPRFWRPYTDARDTAWLVATRGALAAGALFLVGLLVARNRRRALAAVGAALVLSAGAAYVVLQTLPEIAEAVSTGRWAQAAALLDAPDAATVVSVLLPVAAVGAALFVVSLLVPRPRAF